MRVKKMGLIIPFVLVVICVSLTFSAQNRAPQSPTAVDKLEQYEDAHKTLLGTKPDAAKDAVRLTEELAKTMPNASSALAKIPRKNLIDQFIFDRIERDGIPHASLTTDEEYIRRVYLDATGMLPKSDLIRSFVADKDPDKRDKLVDSLIGTEEFAEQWAWFYGDLFRLMSFAGNGKDAFQFWNKEWLKYDRPYNDVVTDMLTGTAKSHSSVAQLAFFGRVLRNAGLKGRQPADPTSYYSATANRLDTLDEITVESTRIFLGVNIDCISCHDGAGHLEPLNVYLAERTRKEFSQHAAFFGRVGLISGFNGGNEDAIIDDNPKRKYNTADDAPWWTESETKFPRTGETYEPAFLFTGEKPRPGMNPRQELARMITTNPQFARASVNLIWTKLMTVGFVESYDGFDLARLDPKNPPPQPWTVQPTNPELLEALAADFRASNHSMHRLMKTIMKSNAYQLSAKFPGEWKDAYTPYYARKYVRVMTGPEVIDAIASVTGRPYKWQFSGTEVSRLKQLTDSSDVPGGGRGSRNTETSDVVGILNSFFENNRQTPPPTGNKPTTLQAILMMTSGLVNDRLKAENGTFLQMLSESSKNNDEKIEELYLATLSRFPTAQEKQWVKENVDLEKDLKTGLQNLQWTLLNRAEFLLNH